MNLERTYSIGPYVLTFTEFCTVLKQFPPLEDIEKATEIKGPFDGKINSIYLIKWADKKAVIFRTRISRAFRYEPIVKEKILYPLLDGTFNIETKDLGKQIQAINNAKEGKYIFDNNKEPVVPVQNLLYYYEPSNGKKAITSDQHVVDELLPPNPFPFLVSIKDFIAGNSFYESIKECKLTLGVS